MTLDIREATLDDAEGVIRILNPIIAAGAYTALDTQLSVDEQRAFIQGFSPRGIFLVAVDRSRQRIVGLQDVDPFSGYTHAFDHVGVIGTFVDLERRRQGIGRALFSAMFPAARAKGYEKLFTYVRADNVAALAAYEAQGFERIGVARQHAKLNGRYVDEVLIERFL
jgi:L-amino acid N-acyltransferase YncA